MAKVRVLKWSDSRGDWMFHGIGLAFFSTFYRLQGFAVQPDVDFPHPSTFLLPLA